MRRVSMRIGKSEKKKKKEKCAEVCHLLLQKTVKGKAAEKNDASQLTLVEYKINIEEY